ncbi:MAG: hypothetical protein CMQ38_05795 [Gammaproteobacteria bacterium]|nr:hypothetical protein [Gammaproteobacteria bacterium]
MSTFTYTISNGNDKRLPGGASFQILESDADVDLYFFYRNQTIQRALGVPASYFYRPYVEGLEFDSLRIVASYGDVTIKVDISDANSGTNILGGAVQVTNSEIDMNQLFSDSINGFRNHDYVTNQGNAFVMGSGQSAVSGEYSHVQIYNPASSGKTVLVDSISLSASVGGVFAIGTSNTEHSGGPVAWRNRKNSGSAGAARIGAFSDASGQLTARETLHLSAPAYLNFKFPYLLEEGEGLAVIHWTPNVLLYASFSGREI